MIIRTFSLMLITVAFTVTAFKGTAFAQRPNILLVLSDDHSVPHSTR